MTANLSRAGLARWSWIVILIALISAAGIAIYALGGGAPSSGGPHLRPQDVSAPLILGGSTFLNPQAQVWVSNFSSLYPKIRVTYNSVGSGAGVSNFLKGVYDAGATDVPMPPATYREALDKYGSVLTVPLVIGGEAIIYNLPSSDQPLRLNARALAAIYLGEAQYWDDPLLTALNPWLQGQHQRIVAVHRSDGSGTTFYFTLWLSKNVPKWNASVGSGYTVNWPVDALGNGLGGKGNEGVAAYVQQNPWSLGYVEVQYAVATGLRAALLENPSTGEFVKPTAASLSIAASKLEPSSLPPISGEWYGVAQAFFDVNSSGAYPLVGFSYLHLASDHQDLQKAAALYLFLNYTLTRGQALLLPGYVGLPPELSSHILLQLGSTLSYRGTPVASLLSP
jgi:phosphate transport system substrate-binding protein